MTPHRFKVLLEGDADESVWVTYVPALNHLSTYGETREDGVAGEQGISIPTADLVELTEVEVANA